MKLLPSENLVYITRLSREEIIQRLVETSQFKSVNRGIGYNTFNIQRVISYRNSFLPEIKGEIEDQGRDRIVKVEMKLYTFVAIFMIVWLAVVATIGISFLAAMPAEGGEFFIFLPVMMLVFGVAMFYGGFKYESTKSKKELQQILDAELLRGVS